MAVTQVFDLWHRKNLWRAPDWNALFGIQLEGAPPPRVVIEQRFAQIAQLRHGWSPNPDGWELLRAISTACLNNSLLLKFYDQIIVELDESEGPEPLVAVCQAIKLLTDATGAIQAFLLLWSDTNPLQRESFSERRQLCIPAYEIASAWVNLADVYEIQVLGRPVE